MILRYQPALRLSRSAFQLLYRPGLWLSRIQARRAFREIPANLELPFPRTICLEPTLRCNLSCNYCYQQHSRSRKDKELTLDQIRGIFDGLQPEHIKLIGGEVLLRDDALELIEWASSRSRSITLVSNGSLLDSEKVAFLKGLRNLHRLSISSAHMPDGKLTPLAHIQKIAPFTRDLAGSVPLLAQLVVGGDNTEEIRSVIDELPQAGFRIALLMIEMIYDQQEIDRSREMLETEMGWQGGGLLSLPPPGTMRSSLSELSDAVNDIRKYAAKRGVFAFCELMYGIDRIQRFYKAKEPEGTQVVCRYLIEPTLRVDPYGNVIFCQNIRQPLGNLLHQKPDQIWNGEPMLRLRRLLLEGNFLPICRRCCRFVHLA